MDLKLDELDKTGRHGHMSTGLHDATSYVSSIAEDDVRGEDEWRNIIFIPFDKRWETLIIILVLLNTFIVVYQIMFGTLSKYVISLDYIHESLYFVDTLLSALHRNMKNHSKKRKHIQKNLLFITIDVLTLIPAFNIYMLVLETSGHRAHEETRHIARMQTIPRFYRVLVFFSTLRNTAGLNQLLIVCLYLIIRIVFLTLTIVAVFYPLEMGRLELRSVESLGRGWKALGFQTNTPFETFSLLFITIGNLLIHSSHGLIGMNKVSELIVMVFTIFVGYLFHIMVAYGELTSVYIKRLTRHFEFTWHFHVIEKFLNDWNLSQTLKEKVLQYYHDFWKRGRGFKKIPNMVQVLPINMRKEIEVDLAWEALKHSHLFTTESMAFKKALAMYMQYKFFLPGDIIFRTGDTRSRMLYLNSGIVQVLSDEDDESPILSFSNGTLIGEACCLMLHTTKVILKCATHCEIQMLDIWCFYQTLLLFPNRTQYYHDVYKKRIEKAKIGLRIVARNFEMKKHSLVLPETTIKSLKRRWRLLSTMQKDTKKTVNISEFGEIDGVHTSEFLNMLVLSDDVDLKLKAIFLTKQFPFILDPDSDVAIVWYYITIAVVMVMDIFLPLNVCFDYESFFCKLLLTILDILYMLDVYIQLSTAIKLKQQTITKMTQITIYRFSQLTFIVDVVAALPIDYYLISFTHVSVKVPLYLKLLRLLKTYKVVQFLFKLQSENWHWPLLTRFCKYIFLTCIGVYFMAAFHYAVSCNWFGFCKHLQHMDLEFVVQRIVTTIFMCTSLLVGTHGTEFFEENLFLYLISYILEFIGYMLFSFCFSEFCALFVLESKHENDHQGEMNSLRTYLYYLNLPKTLFRKLQEYLIFTWQFNRNSVFLGPKSILSNATRDIREQVLKKKVIDVYKGIRLFDGCSEVFFSKLFLRTRLFVVPPNFHLIKYNAETRYLRLLSRGYCELTSHIPIDFAYGRTTILKPGDAFSLLEFLDRIPSFISVKSITAVEVFYITFADVENALKFEKIIYNDIATAIRNHKEDHERILQKLPGRLPELYAEEKSLGRGGFFTYTVSDETELSADAKRRIDAEKKIKESLGKSAGLFSLFMLPWTINPQSKFYLTWEAIICTVAIIRVTMNCTRYNLLAFTKEYSYIMNPIDFVIDVFLYVDIYVRLHIQYYNKNGLLVTNHYYTSLQYLKSNFAVDVLILMPYHDAQMTRIFGKSRIFITDVIASMLFRNLQLYHVFGFLSYFQIESSKVLSATLSVIKGLILLFTVFAVYTNLFALITCDFDADTALYSCERRGWLSTTIDPHATSPCRVFFLAFYVVISGFTTAITGIFKIVHVNEMLMYVLILLTGVVARIYFVAAITSKGISGTTSINKFQQQIGVFLKFVKNETVDEDLIQETISHYEYMFKKTKGRDFYAFTKVFYPSLCIEFSFTVFECTLRQVHLFRNLEHCFYRGISSQLNLLYFKKDTPVIRCNDVQDSIYFVHKGSVDVVVAKQKICTLYRGGAFGNFQKKRMRQTISAYTRVHTELIVINNVAFHKFISSYPKLIDRISHINELNCEFWESDVDANTKIVNVEAQPSALLLSSSSNRATSQSVTSRTLIRAIQKKISHNNQYYKIWQHIMEFHLAAMSSILMNYFIFMGPQNVRIFFMTFKYTMDVAYLSMFYFGFRTTFTNSETGIVESDTKLIAMRYLKSLFWLDLLSVLPLDLTALFFGFSYRQQRYMSANRLLRYFYVILFYAKNKYKLKGIAFVRWSYLIYNIMFVIQCLTSLWYVFFCWGFECYMVTGKIKQKAEFTFLKNRLKSNLMAYYYVINLFTLTGLTAIQSQSYKHMIISVVIIFCTQYLTAVLARVVASHLVVKYSAMSSYEFLIQELRDYLKSRELSPSILKKMWEYLLDLWVRRNGQALPLIIKEAPFYLKQDIMYAMYGRHLENHYLFAKTHVDFLRQLVCHLKPYVFFPNNIIVEKYDVDSTMYFLHSGEVEVYDVMGKNMNLQKVLTKGMTFGEPQGLYNIPHTHTFKAITVCDVLILRRRDWIELLKWFPASEEQIHIGAKENIVQIFTISDRSYDFNYEIYEDL